MSVRSESVMANEAGKMCAVRLRLKGVRRVMRASNEEVSSRCRKRSRGCEYAEARRRERFVLRERNAERDGIAE